MFHFICLFLLTSLISVCPSLANSESQFWCNLPGVQRCVDKANNLTECNCTLQNQTYCPSNNSCQPPESYNESLCWSNISCSIEPTTVTPAGTALSIVPTTSFSVSVNSSASAHSPHSQGTTTRGPTTFHPLDTDYTPIIISVAAGFACFVFYVCCMCCVHSWWLKRNKFTDVNSTPLKDIEKKRRKEELREMRRQRKEEEETKEPSKFDMGYRKPQKVNERALANYDWTRTSYLPGMLEPSRQDPNPAESAPKLILDDEDTEFDDPNDLGDDNNAYESGHELEAEHRTVSSSSSLFSPVEVEPQEPVMVEPEIFESMEEIPRPPPDGDMADSLPPGQSQTQDYYSMMGRF